MALIFLFQQPSHHNFICCKKNASGAAGARCRHLQPWKTLVNKEMEAKQRYILPRSCPLGNDWIFLLPAQSQSPQEHRYKCCWKPVNPLRRSMWWDISCSSCLWHQTHTQAHSQACPFRTEEPGNGGWWRWNISWPEQEIKSWIRLVRTDSDSHLVRRWGGLPHGCSSCRARMELCDN